MDGIRMTKSRRLLPAEYVGARPNTYGDVLCYSCDTSIMDYVKRTGKDIHASSNRSGGDKCENVKYRCGDCYNALFGGVSLRVVPVEESKDLFVKCSRCGHIWFPKVDKWRGDSTDKVLRCVKCRKYHKLPKEAIEFLLGETVTEVGIIKVTQEGF